LPLLAATAETQGEEHGHERHHQPADQRHTKVASVPGVTITLGRDHR
jgi:hypothetical protein